MKETILLPPAIEFPQTFRASRRWLLRRQVFVLPPILLLCALFLMLYRSGADIVVTLFVGFVALRFLAIEVSHWIDSRVMSMDEDQVIFRRLNGFARWRVSWFDIKALEFDEPARLGGGTRDRLRAIVPFYGDRYFDLPLHAMEPSERARAREALETGRDQQSAHGGIGRVSGRT